MKAVTKEDKRVRDALGREETEQEWWYRNYGTTPGPYNDLTREDWAWFIAVMLLWWVACMVLAMWAPGGA